MANSKILIEEKLGIAKQIQAMAAKWGEEKRSATAEEREQFDAMNRDYDSLKDQIETLLRVEKLDNEILADLRSAEKANSKSFTSNRKTDKRDCEGAIRAWLAKDEPEFFRQAPEWKESAERLGIKTGSKVLHELVLSPDYQQEFKRDLLTTAGTSAFIPTNLSQAIYDYVLSYGGILSAAGSQDTGPGDFKIPRSDDTGNTGHTVAEAGPDTSGIQSTIDAVTITIDCYTSYVVKVSYEMIANAGYDIIPWLTRQLATRLYRKIATDFVSGSGAIKGLISNATSAATTASATTFTWAELCSLYYGVDPIFRASPSACWIMSNTAVQTLRSLVSTTGQPIWSPGQNTFGTATNAPDTLNGAPVVVDNSMATVAANSKSVGFGDPKSAYFIRTLGGVNVQQLNELYAYNREVGVFCYQLIGAATIDAGAFKILTQHS